jgi:hypothetical protein
MIKSELITTYTGGLIVEEIRDNVALYAAVKTFHSNGHDMWAAVEAMTLIIMPISSTDEDVKRNFSLQYKIEIPSDVLKTILSRLKKHKYITQELPYNTLTKTGEVFQSSLNNSVSKVRREFLALVDDFKNYLKTNGKNFSQNAELAILNFIDDNIGFASDVLTSTASKPQYSVAPSSDVAGYILSIEKSKPDLFDMLQSVFFGRLYITLIKTRAELDTKAKFDKLDVFLDTNVLLSLLGLHGDILENSAKELLDMFKEFSKGINVSILEETVTETLKLLDSFGKHSGTYVGNIGVDSTQYLLKMRNINSQDLRLLAETLPEEISKLGIEIKITPKINSADYDEFRAGLSSILTQSTSVNKSPSALNHDATLLASIKFLRGRNNYSRLLEKSKAIFVSPDSVIHEYSKELARKGTTSFPLSIRPIDIISLLWVKAIGVEGGKFNGSLMKHAVMGYARERLISSDLWAQFTSQLKEAESKGKITRDNIGILLADDETQKLLSSNKPEVVDKIIDPKFVETIRRKHKQTELDTKIKSRTIKGLETTLQQEAIDKQNAELRAEKSEQSLEMIDARIRRISKILSNSLLYPLLIVLAIILIILVWNITTLLTPDTTASYSALFGITIVAVIVILLGREFKPVIWFIGVRRKTFIYVERTIYRLLVKILRAN